MFSTTWRRTCPWWAGCVTACRWAGRSSSPASRPPPPVYPEWESWWSGCGSRCRWSPETEIGSAFVVINNNNVLLFKVTAFFFTALHLQPDCNQLIKCFRERASLNSTRRSCALEAWLQATCIIKGASTFELCFCPGSLTRPLSLWSSSDQVWSLIYWTCVCVCVWMTLLVSDEPKSSVSLTL